MQASEWALLRKHESEDTFGIQIAGSHQDQMKRVCKVFLLLMTSNCSSYCNVALFQILSNETSSDFVVGCITLILFVGDGIELC